MAQATLMNYFRKEPAEGSTSAARQRPRTIPRPALESGDLHDSTRDQHFRPEPPLELTTANSGPERISLNPSTPPNPSRPPPSGPKHELVVAYTATQQNGLLTSETSAKDFQITTITPDHIPALTALTSNILPVRYTSKFYNEVIHEPDAADLSRTVLYLNHPIGWISCRVQPLPSRQDQISSEPRNQIYIRALCILAPYRERGLATQLLTAILDPDLLSKYHVAAIYAHVWESNAEALEWYEKRGFRKTEMVERYYTRLKPAGAWIVRREIGVKDYLKGR